MLYSKWVGNIDAICNIFYLIIISKIPKSTIISGFFWFNQTIIITHFHHIGYIECCFKNITFSKRLTMIIGFLNSKVLNTIFSCFGLKLSKFTL